MNPGLRFRSHSFLCESSLIATGLGKWKAENKGAGEAGVRGGSTRENLLAGPSPAAGWLLRAELHRALPVACSEATCPACGLGERANRERDGERRQAFVNYEREDQMRGDNCFSALLLLNKSALQVGRKVF